jgi:hypothetical protein
MEETPQPAVNRGPWIIAGAIMLAALIIVGYLVYQNRQNQNCEEWQAFVRALKDETGLSMFQVVNIIEDSETNPRPGGCPNL